VNFREAKARLRAQAYESIPKEAKTYCITSIEGIMAAFSVYKQGQIHPTLRYAAQPNAFDLQSILIYCGLGPATSNPSRPCIGSSGLAAIRAC
jgi:hypothetical protein